MDSLLNVKEAARLLKLTPGGVYASVARRQLPVVRLGKRLRFRQSDLEKLIASGFTPVEQEPDPYGKRGLA